MATKILTPTDAFKDMWYDTSYIKKEVRLKLLNYSKLMFFFVLNRVGRQNVSKFASNNEPAKFPEKQTTPIPKKKKSQIAMAIKQPYLPSYIKNR